MLHLEKKLFFIYNPHAGKENIKGKLYGIIQAMSDAGYAITIYPTRAPQDAIEQIRNLPDDYDLVVCSGGDGTLDEVMTGMMYRKHKIPVGYIPAGSCNDFARSLQIPNNMDRAAEIAVRGVKQEVKNVLGHMAYVLEGMKQLMNVKSYQLKVTSDEASFEGDFLFGMITNSKSVGGFKSIVGKNVIFDDGVFEMTFITRPKNPMELQEILAALLIEQIDTKYMYSFRSSRVVIESEEPVPWTLDGEFGGEHTHVEITNNQRAVEIRMPEEVRDTLVAEEEEGY